MAELRLARQQYDDAMDSSEHSSTMLERLRTDKPAASVLRELSAAYDIRARAIDAAGHSDLALVWRDKDLAIVKQLAGSDPDNIEWRHDLALSLEARGGLLDKLRQPDAALDAYGQAIAILEALPAQSRIPPDWLRDTARTIGERGALLKLRGRTAEAVEDFRRKLALLERLAASALDTVTDNDLENAYRQAREALLEADRTAEALETAEQQLFAISVAANRDTRDFTRLAQVLSSVCWTAILARDTPRAELAGREAVALDRKNDGARLNYAHALMFSGNLAAARKIYLDGPGAGEARAAKWRESIRKDFKVLAANNLRHPLMDEIERDIPP
jgi:tetratricopeptide (TPR) repeat protein